MLDLAAIVACLLFLTFSSSTLNCICLHFLRFTRFFNWKPSTILLANLLVTHLAQGLIVQPLYVGKSLKTNDDFLRVLFKDGFLFSYLLTFYGVCFGVLMVAVDRFLATYLISKYKMYVTVRRTMKVVTATWVYVFALCLLPFIPVHMHPTSRLQRDMRTFSANSSTNTTIQDEPSLSNISNNDTLYLSYSWQKQKGHFYCPRAEWTAFMLLCNAALPYLVIVCCYGYVINRLQNIDKKISIKSEDALDLKKLPLEACSSLLQVATSSAIKSTTSPPPNHGTLPCQEATKGKHAKKRQPKKRSNSAANGFKSTNDLTYFTIGLLFIYFILWTPSIVYYTLLSLCAHIFPSGWDNSKSEKRIVFVIKLLSYLCGLLSPLFYTCRNHEMKRFLRATLRTKVRMLSTTSNEKIQVKSKSKSSGKS